MKTAMELFNWYYKNYEPSNANKRRLDAVDLELCLKEHDRELTKKFEFNSADQERVINKLAKENYKLKQELNNRTI